MVVGPDVGMQIRDRAGYGLAPLRHVHTKYVHRCGPCQRIAPIYEQLSGEFPGVTFYKVRPDRGYVSVICSTPAAYGCALETLLMSPFTCTISAYAV